MTLTDEPAYRWQPSELWVLLTLAGAKEPRLASREVYRHHRGALHHAARGAAIRWRAPVRAVPLVEWVRVAECGGIAALWAKYRHREVGP